MIPAENGEDSRAALQGVRLCGQPGEGRDRLARLHAAERRRWRRLQQVATPGASTIEQVSAFLKCQPQELIKTLIYVADGQPIAVLVRGDHEANEGQDPPRHGKAREARTGPAGGDRTGHRRAGRFCRARWG